MERFRLRARIEPKRGLLWELHLFPDHPHRQLREADGRLLGSASTPEAILWLRQASNRALQRAEDPEPTTGEAFGPAHMPRWLRPEDGMRLALGFSAARWLATPRLRRMFREGLEALPSEVVLYWFILCFYGYHQPAGRAALRTLFLHQESESTGFPTVSAVRLHPDRRGDDQLEGGLFPAFEAYQSVPIPFAPVEERSA